MAVLLAWGSTSGVARADDVTDGKKALKEGNVEEAIARFKQATQAEPTRAEAFIGLGNALERRRRWEEALNAYSQAAKLDLRSAEAQRGMGASLVKLGRLEEGAKAYRQATELDHKFPDAALGLGDVLVQLKQYDEAVKVLQEGTGWGAKVSPFFYEGLGRAEAARGKFKEAEVYLLKARELAPNNPRFHRALGDLYTMRKIPSLAVVSYQQAIDLDPNDLDSRFAMGRALARDSRYNDALEQYKAIVTRDSTYDEAYKEMGQIYVRASDTNPSFINDAVTNLEKANRLAPGDPETAAWLARAYVRLGRKDEAANLLTPFAQGNKLTPEGHLAYGRVLYEKQDFANAVAEFRRAGDRLEDLDYMRLAHSLRVSGQGAAADSLYMARWAADSSANKPAEKSSSWILERGKLRYALGKADKTKYAEAIPFFQRKIELDPKNDEAYYYMGLSLQSLDRYAEADTVLAQAEQLAPTKGDRHFWRAVGFTKLHRDAEACEKFRQVVGLDTTTTLGAIARQRVGYCLLLEKKWPEAIEILEASTKIDPKQPQTWVWLGQAYQNSGQKQKAIEAYRKALELDPNQPDARKGLAQLSAP